MQSHMATYGLSQSAVLDFAIIRKLDKTGYNVLVIKGNWVR